MEYQHPHGHMRPPPPSTAEPYQRPPLSVPPPPPSQPWPYSATQFQYQSQTQHSPSPPPPQWRSPQSSDRAPYPSPHFPVHQPSPYPAQPHYPPSHPLPPRPLHAPLPYSQDWGSSWTPQQSWQYQTNNNEEDWGAKAKAWLAAKAATENQNPSPQFVTGGGTEEKYQYREQYSQCSDPHTQFSSASNYQQYPGAVGPTNHTGLCQFQESQDASSGQSSYGANMHVASAARDGCHSTTPINPLVHQQEVPSSYSSVAGNEEVGDRYESFNSSSSLPVALPPQHVQLLSPGRDGRVQEPRNFGSIPAESPSTLRDQPFNFAPQLTRNLDPHAQPNYNYSSGAVRGGETISSNYAWPSSTVPGGAYPLLPPPNPSVAQVDHPIAMPSPASGHPAPMFPTGPSFQPTIPMIGAAFGVGVGVAPPPTAFPVDAHGVSERPKKASVPNWLREEIIKNKAVITSSVPEIPKDDSQSIEEDSIGKSFRKGYQGDSKSIDSSRSTEDEDEDEDDVEAARTAAINQEIKRVLTEVLMKVVTDELFDEIATKVLIEDDLSVEVGRDVGLSNHQMLPSMQSVSRPKASAKILTPIKTKDSDYEDASEKSTSAPPGDILGLGSYVSDEEDEDIQSNFKESSTHLQSFSGKPLKGSSINENGSSMGATEEQSNFPAKLDSDSTNKKSPVSATPEGSVAKLEFSDYKKAGDLAFIDEGRSSKRVYRIAADELQHEPDISKLNNSLNKKVERNEDDSDARRVAKDDSGIQDIRNRYDKNDRTEHKRSSANKDPNYSESSMEGINKKGDEGNGRHSRTERPEYHNNSEDKGKEKGRTDGIVKNNESRKRHSSLGGKEGCISTEIQRDKRASEKKEYNDRREDGTRGEKRERSRDKIESKSSQHKRRHSSSVRDRDSKDNSLVNRARDSSHESLNDSRRKSHDSHHSRRRKSPSPVRSRKRGKRSSSRSRFLIDRQNLRQYWMHLPVAQSCLL
ncbi:cyclin-related [Striga hermonthica]|uniref:Cyclin-related n=1 Tax=Striga hermonthica TaxID=68872 RepID=A0A9N7NQV5_STRHE|nr:cyclin-related [Striga hermonthica]